MCFLQEYGLDWLRLFTSWTQWWNSRVSRLQDGHQVSKREMKWCNSAHCTFLDHQNAGKHMKRGLHVFTSILRMITILWRPLLMGMWVCVCDSVFVCLYGSTFVCACLSLSVSLVHGQAITYSFMVCVLNTVCRESMKSYSLIFIIYTTLMNYCTLAVLSSYGICVTWAHTNKDWPWVNWWPQLTTLL